jgi:hypothetical protein
MLRNVVRAALTAVLIPIASTFALAQAPPARQAILPGSTHYTIFSSSALTAAVTPFLDVENAQSAPTSR